MADAPEKPTKCVSNSKTLAQGPSRGSMTWGCWCCVCSAQHLAGSSPELRSGPAGQSPSRPWGHKDRAGCPSPPEAWACPAGSSQREGTKIPTTPAGLSSDTKNLWNKIWRKRGLFAIVLFLYSGPEEESMGRFPVPFTLGHSCASQGLIFFVVNCSKQDICHILNSSFPLS